MSERLAPQSVHVPLLERGYDIIVGQRLLSQAGQLIAPVLRAPRVIVISDEAVAARYATPLITSLSTQGIRADLLTIPVGEGSKSFALLEALIDQLLALQPDRNTTLVALGGGVVGDVVGFAASILLRGVDFIQIPTTLLAQVDSSVGGKTGINTKAGKNLVGSFYQPRMVLADLDALTTLPARELRAGYAEVIKYGLIMKPEFYQWCERHGEKILACDMEYLQRAVIGCCQMKAEIVGRDERESSQRAWLNFGHTFGHALEAETGFCSALLHGEAVAIGMVMACRLSHHMGLIGAEVETNLAAHVKAVGLPATPRDIAHAWNAEHIAAHFVQDKKAEAGTLTFVVLEKLGKAAVKKQVESALALRVVQEFLE